MSEIQHRHTSSEFDEQLDDLRTKLLLMASHVEGLIADALAALAERDTALAEAVIARDREIDRLEKTIDDLCLKILALRQPAARDLRHITTAFKVVTDLERMGDLCVNIARSAIELNRMPRPLLGIDLSRIGAAVREMVRRSLDAFVDGDAELARQIVLADKEIDRQYNQVFHGLVHAMVESPVVIEPATQLLFIARHLERIADHATNIAEQVIFLVEGDDIRHEKARLRVEAGREQARAAEESDREQVRAGEEAGREQVRAAEEADREQAGPGEVERGQLP
jgi:phosphate transport system protein